MSTSRFLFYSPGNTINMGSLALETYRVVLFPDFHFVAEVLTMADDKKKVGSADRNLISFKQKYEFDYAVRQLQKQVPDASKQAAKKALTEAARQVSPSEGREKVMKAARKNLK